MQKNLFIIFVGIVISIIVFAVWQTAGQAKKVSTVQIEKENVSVDLVPNTNKKTMQKVIVPKVKKDIAVDTYVDMNVAIKQEIEPVAKTIDMQLGTMEKMQEHTQEIYDALVPDEYEETMEDAKSAFETLDEHVAKVDARIAEEQSGIEEQIVEGAPPEEESLTEEQESEGSVDLPITEEIP